MDLWQMEFAVLTREEVYQSRNAIRGFLQARSLHRRPVGWGKHANEPFHHVQCIYGTLAALYTVITV
jgi:hypothetical protein